jgi:type II secretory pathway pseudopilin PulG
MRQLAKIAILGTLLLAAAPAFAQDATQDSIARENSQDTNWRELLTDLYRLDLAIDRCDQVQPSGREMVRLENAITFVEKKLALSADTLDEVYAKIEYETEADKNDFCSAMTNAVDAIRKIPAEYRD